MNTEPNLKELIAQSIKWRVKDAVDATVEDAKKRLDDRLKQIAVDVAIDIEQNQFINEMAQEIRLVIISTK